MDPLIRVDLAVTGGRLVAHEWVRTGTVLVRDGRITAVTAARVAPPPGDPGYPGDQGAGRLGALLRDGGMRLRSRRDVARYDNVASRAGTADPGRVPGADAATRFRPRGTPQ